MVNAIRPLIGLVLTALMAAPVFANNNASVTSPTSVMQAPKKDGRRWSGFISASRSTNLINHEDGTQSDAMDYLARLNLKLTNNFSLRVQGGYSQDMKDAQNDDFSNTSVSLRRSPFDLNNTFKGTYRLGMIAPTSKDAHKRQNLLTGVTVGGDLMINPDRLITGLDIMGGASVTRNIHQYETALDGAVNTQYSSSQMVSVSYSFESGIALSATFTHMNTWSYQDVMRDSFDFSQEIGYDINSSLNIAAGHTNSGSTLRPNGTDSNVKLLDEESSLIYASATFIF